MTEKRPPIDWEAIHRDYLAGILSVHEIARQHEISHTAINKRAKRDGWVRQPRPKEDRTVILEARDDFSASGFVYVIFIETSDGRFFKIGMTRVFGPRFSEHQCSSPFEMKVACVYFVANMRAEERELHSLFEGQKVRGEWFRLASNDLAMIASRSLLVTS